MNSLFLFNLVTLDGFYAGPNGDIDWHNVDEEFNQFAIKQLNEIDVLLFGKTTYDLMASYWPTDEAKTDDSIIASKMNSISKIVFSTTMQEASWENTTLVHQIEKDKLLSMKETSRLAIFGSGKLAVDLINQGLVDELRILVNPVILSEGMRHLEGISKPHTLQLVRTQQFQSGNVLLVYKILY